MTMSRRATVLLSLELVAEALQLPPGSQVHHVELDYRNSGLRLYVTSPDLPEVGEGCIAPDALLEVTVHEDGTRETGYYVMSPREYIELGGFGVLEDGKLTKFQTAEEAVEEPSEDGTVNGTEDPVEDDGEEVSE